MRKIRTLPAGLGLLVVVAAALSASCGPPSPRPVSFPDPDVTCPGGQVSWGLQIEDQRVDREAEEKMRGAVREAMQKTFPGCRWNASDPDSGTVTIEVHRFASRLDSGSWEAAVEWTVTARDGAGHTRTQFEVNEEVSRPNYQGSNNEKESLSEAFRKAVERTARGLTAMSISERLRPPVGTAGEAAGRSRDSARKRPTPAPQSACWRPNPDSIANRTWNGSRSC